MALHPVPIAVRQFVSSEIQRIQTTLSRLSAPLVCRSRAIWAL